MALSPEQVRQALVVVTQAGQAEVAKAVSGMDSPDEIRDTLLEVAPDSVAYWSDGSAALAVDWYDDLRDESPAKGRFTAEPVVDLRAEKIRRGIRWGVDPLYAATPDEGAMLARVLPIVQKEIATPFRDTVTVNGHRDPASVGWRRIARPDGCKFCRMLADKGAIFKRDTALFAAHKTCHCTAQPVFDGQGGEEASVMQYLASKKRRSEADKARLREYLNANY